MMWRMRYPRELWRNLDEAVGSSGAVCGVVCGDTVLNMTFSMTFGNWFAPFGRRRVRVGQPAHDGVKGVPMITRNRRPSSAKHATDKGVNSELWKSCRLNAEDDLSMATV